MSEPVTKDQMMPCELLWAYLVPYYKGNTELEQFFNPLQMSSNIDLGLGIGERESWRYDPEIDSEVFDPNGSSIQSELLEATMRVALMPQMGEITFHDILLEIEEMKEQRNKAEESIHDILKDITDASGPTEEV